MEDVRCMKEDVVDRLKEFMENEARSCSMDLGASRPSTFTVCGAGALHWKT